MVFYIGGENEENMNISSIDNVVCMLCIFPDLYDMKKRAGFVDGFLRCHLPVFF